MLELIEVDGVNKWGRTRWKVKCECGNIFTSDASSIKSGHTKSCGCLQRKSATELCYKHGESRTELYKRWQKIKDRCYNKKQYGYHRYGGRGIKICDEWLDFIKFKEWAILSGYKKELTIERIDIDKDYCPENCTWIKKSEQSKNTCRTIKVEINNEIMCLKDACNYFNINYKTVSKRLSKGMETIEALTKKVDKRYSRKRAI